MPPKPAILKRSLFLRATVAFLIVAAAAKLVAVSDGTAEILQARDPLFNIKFASLLQIVAVIELAITALCLFGPQLNGFLAVAWLSTVFLVYRIGLWWVGWKKPCSCLGNLTDALHISPQLADNVIKGLLAFMFVGSVSHLIAHFRSVHCAEIPAASDNT